MRANVDVFVMPPGQGPAAVPEPGGRREVEASTTDGLRRAAVAALEADGYRLRALSFGPDGLVAYVEVSS